MLDWLKKNTLAAREKLTTEVGKFKNKEFMEAIVAGCALVAAADGEISSAEKLKMSGFIKNSDELKVFDMDKVIEAFNRVCSKFEFDEQIGRAEALAIVGKIKDKPEQARLLIRVCMAIGASDGDFDDQEKAVCRLLCAELGLTPSDFDL
ncbi:MAG: Tellurite resistance TerB [Pseudomonas sp.]|nr:Tellurite resistance TerB [Pseudomonas sp.]MBB52363.1 Tellurite resistance TerB [Pseudomonadales bacterium]|tara:strand:+ start:11413 stop:11862 length:450 start_codon:yes stop_codon:yes gene_type:complete